MSGNPYTDLFDDCPPHGIARPRHLEVVRWS